jgi:hypothetical protein
MRAFFAFLGVVLLLAPPASAATVRKYDISLRYDPATTRVDAAVTLKLAPGNDGDLVFYLHDELTVSSLSVGGKPLSFRQEIVPYDFSYDLKANRVRVAVGGANLSGGLKVVYAGRFSPSALRSPSDYMRGDKDGLFLRSYGYSLWFPIFAEAQQQLPPADFGRVRISLPAAFHAVFVGEFLGRSEKNGIATDTWTAKEVGGFDAQLTIRRFRVTRIGPVTTYYLSDAPSVASAGRIAALSGTLLEYYRSHYRAAAADRPIYVVQEPEYGDIAGHNVIGVQDKAWRAITPQSWEAETLAHELVHAFVQTKTPVNDPFYAFEVEGFPSYFHLPALASVLGDDFYEKRMDRVQKRYLERRASGKDGNGDPLPPEKPLFAMTQTDVGLYKDMFVLNDRALLFWDYLRRRLDRPVFDDFVRALTARPTVTAADFFALLQGRAPGVAADAHLWLETAEYPERFHRSVKE